LAVTPRDPSARALPTEARTRLLPPIRSRKGDCRIPGTRSEGEEKRMRREGAGRTRRYWFSGQYIARAVEDSCATYMFVRTAELAVNVRVQLLSLLDMVKCARILDEHSWLVCNRAVIVVVILQDLSVHIATMLAHDIELSIVEHLAKLLELVLWLVRHSSFMLFAAHVLEGFEIGTVLYEAGDVDLCADKVSEGAARVEKRCCHEKVHEW
jgi:hypothetical protein